MDQTFKNEVELRERDGVHHQKTKKRGLRNTKKRRRKEASFQAHQQRIQRHQREAGMQGTDQIGNSLRHEPGVVAPITRLL